MGRYKVTVAKYEAQYESSAGSSETHADYDISDEYPDGYDEYAETQKAEKAKAENALPEKYASPRNTPFTAEVKEGENVFDFALEK
ncbi:MAG: hypothetical protein KatS3mg082_3314 [Nitrospiraceae bacterium]|nr:MAG: hypothetical protein KatS3mg082_3307 [Nitrospiraceae bacterium]GIW56910.1 MAG: hypothetical protein KatS3mg082_3314 [Nitrospiraceae bacterium]